RLGFGDREGFPGRFGCRPIQEDLGKVEAVARGFAERLLGGGAEFLGAGRVALSPADGGPPREIDGIPGYPVGAREGGLGVVQTAAVELEVAEQPEGQRVEGAD